MMPTRQLAFFVYGASLFMANAAHIKAFPEEMGLKESKLGKYKVDRLVVLEKSRSERTSIQTYKEFDVIADRLLACIEYEFKEFGERLKSAEWVPYYNMEDCFKLNEKKVYINFLSNLPAANHVLLSKHDPYFDLATIDMQ